MKKESVAHYTDKWNSVWDIAITETKNIQTPEEMISLLKKSYPFTSDSTFEIEGLEIFIYINDDTIKINYGGPKTKP